MDRAFSDDLALARHLAAVAGELSLGYFQRGVSATFKADESPVTEADVEIERCLRALLATHRPNDAVLGEELGSEGVSARRWLLDPIDGTAGFIAGNAQWGTHVALEVQGEVVLGVITRPLLEQSWWASRSAGAFRSDAGSAPVRLRVSAVSELRRSRVTIWTTQESPRVAELKRVAVWVEPHFDALLRLAEGELEAVVDPSGKAWDHAPAVVLIEEAGGRFCDAQGGRRLDIGEGRFSNGLVHSQLERLLGQGP